MAAWSTERRAARSRCSCSAVSRPARRVVRVLGARQVTQAGLTLAFPAEPLAGLGIGVDALHALSMIPLVVAAPRWRRPALVSGLTAAAFAAVGLLATRRIPGNQTFN